MPKGLTHYSAEIAGERENYWWPVRFDWSDGVPGISQKDEFGEWKERVLLSRNQLKELVAFIHQKVRS